MAVTTAILVVIALGWLWWAIKGKRWLKKCKRRRGGIYLVRTRKHHTRPRWLRWLGLRENGYVGETVSHYHRELDHRGRGRYGAKEKDWADLDPVWHTLTLPWWLCWKWVLRPLETLAILVLWPRYNVAKNGWNPRRISPHRAQAQRLERDRIRAVWGARL